MPMKKIILASGSPRRHEILNMLGIPFTVMIPQLDETWPDGFNIRMVPQYLSSKKAEAVSAKMKEDELLIAADTVVIFQNQILGKPGDTNHAIEMLEKLSGNMHEVLSGVTIQTNKHSTTFSELTRVYFRPLSREMIETYVSKFKPFDKAGAYAIQEWIGLVAIEKINGCYYNVMGLPASRLVLELQKLNVTIEHFQNSVVA